MGEGGMTPFTAMGDPTRSFPAAGPIASSPPATTSPTQSAPATIRSIGSSPMPMIASSKQLRSGRALGERQLVQQFRHHALIRLRLVAGNLLPVVRDLVHGRHQVL